MLVFNDIYEWKGFGAVLKLGSGRCRLRIYDLRKETGDGLQHIRPIFVIVSDLPDDSGAGFQKTTVRSCAGHIATCVTRDFAIPPSRMLWIEYYPLKIYGVSQNIIPETFEAVDFQWNEGRALHPRWRKLEPDLMEKIKGLIRLSDDD